MRRVNVVYGLILNEDKNKVLMVHNVGASWTLPGGAVEEGETLEQALNREVKEETGLVVQVGEVVSINEKFFEQKGEHALFVTFIVNVIGGEISIQYEEEISEIKWVDRKTANELLPFYPGGVEGLLKSAAPYIFQI